MDPQRKHRLRIKFIVFRLVNFSFSFDGFGVRALLLHEVCPKSITGVSP